MINTGNDTLDAILLLLEFGLALIIPTICVCVIEQINWNNRNEDWNNFKFRKKK